MGVAAKTDRVALVTGGSRGIGAATVRLLAENHYRVCVNYVSDRNAANAIVNKLPADRAFAVQADVSNEDDVARMFAEVDDRFGPLTALVNNAGIVGLQSRVDEMDAARVHRILSINVVGSLLCCREAVRRMSLRHGGKGGAIVNLSSVASRVGSPGEYVDYAASKGAVDSLTRGLAVEVADEGIRVNAVRPGFIYTGMHAAGGEPGRVDRLAQTLPMKRGGEPMEVANAIVWLLSDEASYVTGTFLEAAGGR